MLRTQTDRLLGSRGASAPWNGHSSTSPDDVSGGDTDLLDQRRRIRGRMQAQITARRHLAAVVRVKPTIVSDFSSPAPIARRMFGERREVKIAVSMSSGQPRLRICARTRYRATAPARLERRSGMSGRLAFPSLTVSDSSL
jgi:hypothetical protein